MAGRRFGLSSEGFTLLEILIVITIMAIAIGLVASFVGDTFVAYNYHSDQTSASADSAVVLDRVTRVIRGATQVITAGTTSLTVYAYFSPRDSVPDEVTYYVTGTTFMVGTIPASGTAPNYTYNSVNEQYETLLTHLTNASGPIFTYYDGNGNALSGSFAASQVNQVGLSLASNPFPRVLHVPISLQTTVTLRNLKTNL